MPAISDSSPLILYARIGRLGLLGALFGEILVPPASVWSEVVTNGAGRSGAVEVPRAPWIRLQPLAERVDLPAVAAFDRGEAEAIALAIELRIDGPVILDDWDARRVAGQLGLAVVGSAGLLNQAKEGHLIPSVRPLLTELRSAGLFLNDAVFNRFLERAGEL